MTGGRAALCGILLLVVAFGCSAAALPNSQECDSSDPGCEQACLCRISDPTEHCVRLDGCRDDRDCPSGTVCLSRAEDAHEPASPWSKCRASSEGSQQGRCQSASQSFDRALIDGFRVNEMPLVEIAGTSAFAFSPPPDTLFVACAMFGCRPDIRTIGTDLMGNPSSSIVNFARCSLSGEPEVFTIVAPSSEESGLLSFTPSVSAAPCAERQCKILTIGEVLPARKRQMTELTVGCWAYDDTRIIGATRTVPVPADRIGGIANIDMVLAMSGPDLGCVNRDMVDDASCLLETGKAITTGGRTCKLEENAEPAAVGPEFGTCIDGQCRHRCVTAADCPRVVPSPECPAPAVTCTQDAVMAKDASLPSFLGVCSCAACSHGDILDAGSGGAAP